jgi:hypothetical protein
MTEESAAIIPRQPIYLFSEKKAWSDQHQEKNGIWAFYNAPGIGLFTDPHHLPAETYYGYRWSYVAYDDFKVPRLVSAGPSKTFKCLEEWTYLQHCGFDGYNVATIKIGFRRLSDDSCIPSNRYVIPLRCILYVATKHGRVRGNSMLVYQPLSCRLFVPDHHRLKVAERLWNPLPVVDHPASAQSSV